MQKAQKKIKAQADNLKMFNACKVNNDRKFYSKLWISVKDDVLPLVESEGGFIIGHYQKNDYSLEVIKKTITRFDVKSFKEKHPELYDSFLVQGASTELKTKYKNNK